MPFPESERIIYDINPLAEVICQLRFPAVLRIDSEIPAKYQDAVRHEYPIFGEVPGQDVKLNLPPEIEKVVGAASPMLSFRGRTTYEFISDDGLWKVQLSREAITLFTTDYKRWEDFKEHLKTPLQALIEIYQPAFFIRIGLRYKDVIERSALGLTDVPWAELLKPHIAGELSDPNLAGEILSVASQSRIRLGDNRGQVLINHGLATNEENETCYLIDSDFFRDEKTEVNDAIQVLDYFNRQSGRLFRWCITDRLHDAMRPQQLPAPTLELER
jgi:uncharacterized protein (TIGR04255 family)